MVLYSAVVERRVDRMMRNLVRERERESFILRQRDPGVGMKNLVRMDESGEDRVTCLRLVLLPGLGNVNSVGWCHSRINK